MKKIISIILAAVLFTALTACGSSAQAGTTSTQAVTEAQKAAAESTTAAKTETAAAETTQKAEPESTTAAPAAHSDVLVAFFSATGTTKGVAERIASVTGGDLYEILAAEPYTSADLNYNDRNSRSTKEQNNKSVRPAIGSKELSLEGYTTIYLGFPIWWYVAPTIINTFLEAYDFSGKTIVLFATSGGSGMGNSAKELRPSVSDSTVIKDGKRFSANASVSELKEWIKSLGI